MTKWKGRVVSCAPLLGGIMPAMVAGFGMRPLPLVLALGLTATPVMAADVYWDVNRGSPGQGGSATWDLSGVSWNLSSDGVAGPFRSWDDGALDTAVFGDTAGTVTVDGNVNAGGLTFTTANYTLNGGTVTLGGTGPAISVGTGNTTIRSTLAGTDGITKSGGGTLTLNGANTFSGDLRVNQGALVLDSDSALGAASNRLVMAGGTDLSSAERLSSREVELEGGAVTIRNGAGAARYTGAGGLRVASGVRLDNDESDFTGGVVFSVNGDAYFTSVGNAGEASSLGADGTITFSASDQYSDRLHYVGDGDTSNRDWVMTYSGGTSGAIFLNSGSGTLTLTGDIENHVNETRSMTFSAQQADLELLGTIRSAHDTTVTFSGGGAERSITVGGSNTYSGATIIGHANSGTGTPTGTVTIKAQSLADTGVESSFGTGTAGGITLLNNSKVSYTGGGSSSNRSWTIGNQADSARGGILNDGSGALTLTGDVFLNEVAGNSLTLGGSFNGTNLLSGTLSGTGELVMDGSSGSVWALSGSNTRQGALTVQGGTLRADSSSAFGTVTDIALNGGTLDLNGFDLDAHALAGTGGTLALGSGDLSVNHDLGSNTTFAGSITGTGGLTKLGAGTLTLTGSNTYTGATTIGGGTLALDFSAVGAPESNIISSSSALDMAGGAVAVTGAAGKSTSQAFNGMNVSGGNNSVAANAGSGGTLNLNLGAIAHSGGLVDFVQSGDSNITTSNTELGGWATVNGTDYAKVEGGNIVAFTEDDYTDADNAATWQDDQYITDVDGFHGTVNGSVQLAGLRYTEAEETTVSVAAGETLGVDGTIIVAPTVATNNQTITGGALTGTAGGGELGIQQNSSGDFIIASQVVDNGGSIGFTKAGSGRATLANDGNTYTGATTIGDGTLSVASIGNGGVASGIGASSSDASNLVIQGATLQYTGGTTNTDRGFTVGRSGAVQSGTIEVTDTDANLTFGGEVLSADDAGLTKTGAGTLTLANANNSYTGVTSVSGGTLAAVALGDGGANSSIGASTSDSSNVVLSNGGTLNYIGGTTSTDRGMQLGTGGGVIGVNDAGSVLTVSGVIENQGAVEASLTKTGDGTLVLAGQNTYSGGTVVDAGTLRAGSTQAFGQPDAVTRVNAGGVLDLNDFDNTMAALRGEGDVDLGSATLSLGGDTGTFSGTISGTGGVTRTGRYTQTFVGANNTYTGATTIDGGTLSVDSLANGGQASGIGASSSDSANLSIRGGGRLIYTGDSVAIDRGFTLAGGQGWIDVTDVDTTLEFGGDATGPGTLRKDGAGTLVLSGDNTYTGASQVYGGVLRAGVENAFGTEAGAGEVWLANASGAELDLDGFDTTVAFLYGGGADGGNITLDDATLTIRAGHSASTTIYSGAISGTGNLIKNGTSVQRLHGCDSSYSGGTTINGGSIETNCVDDGGANSSIGASSADASNLVLNGGTLRYVGEGDSTNREFTLGTAGGGLDASGTGALNFTSTAPITLDGVDAARTFTLTGTSTADNTLAARIDDSGTGQTSLAKTEGGTWRLTNSESSYTGTTTISGGVLSVAKLADGGQASSIGASTGDAANLVIGNGATLRYTGSGDTTDRLFTLATGVSYIESSGTGAVVFENTAPVTLSGAGARTVGLGGTNTDLNTLGGTIADGPGGVTTLAKNGSGTWVLTGDNGYTGNTVVNDGNLIVGNGGTTGNVGSGNVIVDQATSTLSLNRSDTFTLDGTLSGPGTLAQIGSGTSVLTSNSNSIRATSISGGTLQIDGGLSTSTLALNGSSTLEVNGMVDAEGGLATTLTGDAGASTINVNSGATVVADGDLGAGADTLTLAGTLDTGTGVLSLGEGDDTLVLNDGAQLNGRLLAGAGTDLLRVDNAAALTLDGASVGAFEGLEKENAGTLTLVGDHAYSDGTLISAGTLQLGDGGTSGTLAGDVVNHGALAFNRSDSYTFAGTISGSGAVNQIGSGTTILTGDNSYTGATTVQAGTLLVNGDHSAAAGDTTVQAGATIGGTGIIGGDVVVADGGTVSPGTTGGAAGTLTINGSLGLSETSTLAVNFGEPDVVGGPLNDLIKVAGDLTLDGNLSVTETDGGTFGAGIYRVIAYEGTMTDNGLNFTSSDFVLQTSVANQVNLVNTAGENLNFWDGGTGPQNDGAVNGGNGTWSRSADALWTNDTGSLNAPYDNGTFAIFTGTAGAVDVDNTSGQVEASGMQFAVDGYSVTGDALTLVGSASDPSASTIRVGDGTTEGLGMTATIGADLAGTTTLVKTDLGTLVLSGDNTYTGGTRIEDGTLSVSSDANLGAAAGAIEMDGATLQNTTSFASARSVTLEDAGGTFLNEADLALSGVISGTGALTKIGSGTLVLSGLNDYAGGTGINEGTLSISSDENLGDVAGDVALNGGTLQNTALLTSARSFTLAAGGGTFQTDADLTLTGGVEGDGALTKAGNETLILAAENTYTGGTTISGGTLQLGEGGTSGSIEGDVTNAGTLAFNRSDVYTFDGTISGSGAVRQMGGGTTILTNDNVYTGETTIEAGVLLVDGDQSGATGATSVLAGGTLGGTGVIGGDVDVAAGGSLRPGGMDVTPGTLAINGGLTLADTSSLDYNFGQANVVGGAFNDLITVAGDLELDGVLNVTETAGGDFGPGLYRIISYDGVLTDRGLALGDMPAGDFRVQTSVASQINLVNTTDLTLNFWDGPDGGLNDNNIRGGDGEWTLSTMEHWTTESGALNAPYANGAFAVFAGEAGTVTVSSEDGAVQAEGMQFATDGYTVTGEDVTLVAGASGVATIRVGDGTLAGGDMTAMIDASLSGTAGLEKADLGTLILGGVNDYAGGTTITGGALQVSQDANLGAAGGSLTLDGGALHTTASFDSVRDLELASDGTILTDEATILTLNGAAAGAGGFTKAGAGTLVLGGVSTYEGTTTVAEGVLRAGAEHAFSASSDFSIVAGSQLDLAGFSQTVESLSNSGTVSMSGAPGTRLTVNGDYEGSDGVLSLNTTLGADDSATDRLIVNGDTSGDTAIRVTNIGGAGEATVEGIKVVDVAGASDGNFSLQGDYVFRGDQAIVAGAYAYRLYKNGVSTPTDGDWYLRSSLTDPQDPSDPTAPGNPGSPEGPGQPLYQPGVPVYEAYAGSLQAFNQLGTLQQRVGSRSWKDQGTTTGKSDGTIDASGIWARIEAGNAEFDPDVTTSGTDYDAATWKLQVGIDREISRSEHGRTVAGLYGQYGTIDSDLSSEHGRGAIETKGYSLGGTLTWYGNSGAYFDSHVQVTRYDSDLRSKTAGRRLASGNDGIGYAASVEGGKRFPIGGSWSLTPQAQLSYSSVDFDHFIDPFGAEVSLDKSESLVARLGVAIDHESEWQGANGQSGRSRVYGIANVYYDLADGSRVQVGGTEFKSENDALRGGVGLGWSMNSSDGKYSVYAEALANTSLKNFGDSSDVKGTVGVRMRW